MTTPLEDATDRLLATVDGLLDADWSGPSLCAGWSRAHVVAHLALNAEGLARVLRGIAAGEPATMYDSDAARDDDIDALALKTPSAVRDRLRVSDGVLAAAALRAGDVPTGATFERTPGGQRMPADAVLALRLREVEIHHADLDAGSSWQQWPLETARMFLGSDAARWPGVGFEVRATDIDETWTFGTPDGDGVTVEGPVRALAWWATGRNPGPVLSSSNGTLPTMEGR